MNDKSINIGPGATVMGSQIMVAEVIKNVSNDIANSGAGQELKDRLQELTQRVDEMSKHLSPEKAKETADNLQVLVKEATAAQPRPKWYELSADGLLEAAKTVGAMAEPVVKAVKAVVSLLG